MSDLELKLSEVKAYEKRYLIKSDQEVPFLTDYSDEQIVEIFKDVVFCKFRRYYFEDLSIRNFDLENTRPYQIDIHGHLICDNAWGVFLCKVVDFLLSNIPMPHESLLAFRSSWSKAKIFTIEPRVNSKTLANGMYLDVTQYIQLFGHNHGSPHSRF